MSNVITRVRVFGLIGAIAIAIYPFINVATTFACNTGQGGMCGG